jgi:hypothetical protein
MTVMTTVAVATALASLVIGIFALRTARAAKADASYPQVLAAAYNNIKPGMTQISVVQAVGYPRDPTKQCWTYDVAYNVRVCFGANGQVTQVSRNTPRGTAYRRGR